MMIKLMITKVLILIVGKGHNSETYCTLKNSQYLNFLETYVWKLIWNNSLKRLNICWKFTEWTECNNKWIGYLTTGISLSFFSTLISLVIRQKLRRRHKWSIFQNIFSISFASKLFNYLIIKYKSTDIFELNQKLRKFQNKSRTKVNSILIYFPYYLYFLWVCWLSSQHKLISAKHFQLNYLKISTKKWIPFRFLHYYKCFYWIFINI
jgi:hypothetical protein